MHGDDSTEGVRATVRSYYDALRDGDPLAPYFATDDDLVKCGVFSRVAGGDDVAAALRRQTETTSAWRVESRDLRASERAAHGWFDDVVEMGWTDADRGVRFEFETRWSGVLERRDDDGDPDPEGAWRFVGMHVSTAEDR